MGLISRKHIKALRSFILSPMMESWLLIGYIVSFAVIVDTKIGTMNGSRLRSNSVMMSTFAF